MRRLWLLLGLALVFTPLSGCTGVQVSGSTEPDCTPAPLDAHLQPMDGLYVLPDDGRQPVIEAIDRAWCSVDITIYLLSDDETIDAILRAEARGVDVRIMYESAPFGGTIGMVETVERLADHGVEVHTGPDELRFIHAKYLVVDDQIGIITNQNLTRSAFDSNREFGVVTTVAEDVDVLAAIFEADWNGTDPPAPTDRLIVSPVNAREEITSLIDEAERSVHLYAEVIRDDEVIDALSTAAQLGIEVRLLVDAPSDDLDDVVLTTLASNGVEIRIVGHVYVHAKAMTVDGAVAVIGSHNPTSTSLDENREVSLVLEDPVALDRIEFTFESDWSRATPFGTAP